LTIHIAFLEEDNTVVWHSRPCRRIRSPNGFVYIVYSLGPSTEPCGTPNYSGLLLDSLPLIDTDWYRPCKYEENQFKQILWYDKLYSAVLVVLSRSKRIAWSMVSNAAERSNITRIPTLPESRALKMSNLTRIRAVSVEWNAVSIGIITEQLG
jgi:hypothetical protein